MSLDTAPDFDLGPLSWVQNEIDQAIARGLESLAAFRANTGDDAALKHARSLGMERTLTICNVATSAMVRECMLAYVTRAGVEIGVASTKAFTTQLAALFLLALALAQVRGKLTDTDEEKYLKACLLYTSPSPRDRTRYRMPSSA